VRLRVRQLEQLEASLEQLRLEVDYLAPELSRPLSGHA
jgi:hypothetical protein